MGKSFDVEFFKNALEEAQDNCYKKAPSIKSTQRKTFVEACEGFHDIYEKMQAASTDSEINSLAKEQQKAMKKCVKAASKILDHIDLNEDAAVVDSALKGMIITQATPAKLADFSAKDKKHGKAIDELLKSTALMKEMLGNGGAKGGNFGQAIVTYNQILADLEENEFAAVNKKLAMAVALELAEPIYEFDTRIEVDPIERYNHFAEAYKNGELDPAFPHFSIWELRHVVNCDAKNDQMKWGRDMMINYAPYITVLTEEKLKYCFILETDVLMRPSNWTSSPRTYQQVLSGGGNAAPNAWFGRFILKAHGIPSWGCKQGKSDGFTRWTPTGWETMMKTSWDKCEWKGVSGSDFKGEVDARAAYSPKEYFNKLALLECFAEVLDGRRGGLSEEEKSILHPLRVWRSLSIVQKALMLEPAGPEKFERSGPGGVKTRLEKYLEMFEVEQPDEKERVKRGTLIIPVTSHEFTDGPMKIVDCFKGGKQLNLLGGEAKIDFLVPESAKGKTNLELKVCTVHAKQTPLLLTIDDGEPIPIEVPYTVGEWGKTKPIKVDLSGDETIRFSREKGSMGLVIKDIRLH
eukprot:scaffold1525_cov142-Cylindrotheca_fusiformis.AAC.18